ncbi:MAG TPA: hypothetical protein VFX17_00745 [Patescibacteria group bacterium]|nr:hypothetical protein [Patescibacteria group bacterium]
MEIRPENHPQVKRLLRKIEVAQKHPETPQVLAAIARHQDEIRRHLGLPRLPRPVPTTDREYRLFV